MSFLHDYASNMLTHPLRIAKLSIVFEVTIAVVHKTFGKGAVDPQPLGRHQALAPAVESDIVLLLLEAVRHDRAMTPKELPQMVR
jgi:hypothetical protein